ncbi:hypothetical protein C8Q77DRAFT_1160974 [Trametes polyzona]|nr:hypothetical protein C8Q77DRAFT_1160974 [Trametes polyzona]
MTGKSTTSAAPHTVLGTDPEGLHRFLDEQLDYALEDGLTYQELMDGATSALDEHVFGPRPGETYGIFVRPIPDSKYSMRLFPGKETSRDYCLNFFVLTTTGKPVNFPFKFDLFAGSGHDSPVGFAPAVALPPLDSAFGFFTEQDPPGEEKFLLRDGQSCILR